MKKSRALFALIFGIGVLALPMAQMGCGKGPPGATLELKLGSGPKNLSRSDITMLAVHEMEHGDKDYKGALLRDILGTIPPNAIVRVKAADGYTQTLTAAVAVRDDTLLAYEKEGSALEAPEGPLRLIVPNSPGLSVRSIVSIEVVP